MKLLEHLKKDNNTKYIDNIPYYELEGFIFFYFTLKKDQEVFGISINKPLVKTSDIKVINNMIEEFAKLSYDNIALKNDMIYIHIFEYEDIDLKLIEIAKLLNEFSYFQRKNCVVCGKKVDLNNYKNALIPIDNKCIDRLKNEEETTKLHYSKNIKKSILLSLLGAFGGILPAILITIILGNYNIMPTMLLFLSPFLSFILFHINKIERTKKTDLLNILFSLTFVIIYHILIIIYFSIRLKDSVDSFTTYCEIFDKFLIESLIETIVFYVLGIVVAMFLSKNKTIKRLSKAK